MSWVQRQFQLLGLLASAVFQEVWIDFMSQSRVWIGQLGGRLVGRLRWARCFRRPARLGGLPQAAMFQDPSYDIPLVSLNEGNDLHGPAAAGAAEGIGLIDAFDKHSPASPGFLC